MESTQVIPPLTTPKTHLPDHTQLPESDGSFVKNFQEHPQSIVLTSSIEPVLQKLHPDGNYCIGQDSGIYWRLTDPAEKGAEAPDWFYVPHVPPLLRGEYRRSYVLWQEIVSPLIAIEFVSGNGSEERDKTPIPPRDEEVDPQTGKKIKPGKFWVYEQGIRIPFYAIYEVKKAAVEVYHLLEGAYQLIPPNDRGHFAIPPLGVELGILHGTENPPIPWLRWWDDRGNLLLTGDERARKAEQAAEQQRLVAEQQRLIAEHQRFLAEQERLRAREERQAREEAEQKNERLAQRLRALGIDPDHP